MERPPDPLNYCDGTTKIAKPARPDSLIRQASKSGLCRVKGARPNASPQSSVRCITSSQANGVGDAKSSDAAPSFARRRFWQISGKDPLDVHELIRLMLVRLIPADGFQSSG